MLIAGVDAIKKKEKRDSVNSDLEEDGTRSNSSRSKRTKTLSSEVGNVLKKRWQGRSEPWLLACWNQLIEPVTETQLRIEFCVFIDNSGKGLWSIQLVYIARKSFLSS